MSILFIQIMSASFLRPSTSLRFQTSFASLVSTIFHSHCSLGFMSNNFDNSLFTIWPHHDIIYLLLYVDNIILKLSSSTLVGHVISCLSTQFAMTDIGQISFFFLVLLPPARYFLLQVAFARDILARTYILTCNPYSKHVDIKVVVHRYSSIVLLLILLVFYVYSFQYRLCGLTSLLVYT